MKQKFPINRQVSKEGMTYESNVHDELTTIGSVLVLQFLLSLLVLPVLCWISFALYQLLAK